LADDCASLERDRRSLAEDRQSLQAERAAIAAEIANRVAAARPVERGPAQVGVAEESAENTDALHRRLEALSLLRKESPPEAAASRVVPSTAQSIHPLDEATDEKKAIESYMAQLLQRARGEGDSKETPIYIPVDRATGIAPSSEPAKATEEVVEPQPKPKQPAPRPPAPVADLPAMRELANLSTQAALETHSRSVLINQIYSKSTITLAAILIGAVLMCGTAAMGPIALFAGMASMLAGVVFGARLPLLIADYVRAGRTASGDEMEDYGDDDDAVEPAKP
jgi:hypothetical protein